MASRAKYRSTSNNTMNANKILCGLAVATALGVAYNVRYLHTMEDIVRATRTRFTVRSRLSKLNKNKSIGNARSKMAEIATENTIGFLIGIKGHVLLADANGQTVTDTAPRRRDRRAVTELFIIEKKD